MTHRKMICYKTIHKLDNKRLDNVQEYDQDIYVESFLLQPFASQKCAPAYT